MSIYSLIDEPWLPVLRSGSTTSTQVGLREVFTDPGIVRILGDCALREVPLLRLLIAITVRAGGVEAAPDYLADWSHRFDLLDPEQPFFQTPGMVVRDGVDNLLPDRWTQPGRRLFTTSRGGIAPAAAARWLVTSHAADSRGIKAPAPGDPRASAGRVYPRAVGWLGLYTITTLAGTTLADTIMLNAPQAPAAADDLDDDLVSDDLPAWERPVTTGAPRKDGPAGLADLYTWQSRRILLAGDEHEITGAIVTYGDDLDDDGARHLDPMLTYHEGKPLRSFRPPWAHLATLRTTALADRIAQLSPESVVQVRWTQADWGVQAAVMDDERTDHVTGAAGVVLRAIGSGDADLTDRVISAVRLLAKRIHTAAGAIDWDPRDVRESITVELADAYRRHFTSDRPWIDTAIAIARAAGRDLIASAPPETFKGRPDPTLGHVDLATAEKLFLGSLRAIAASVVG